jgi:anti-anti-sigma regulatory factor
MAMIAVFLNIDEKDMVATLQEAGEKLDGAEGEPILDFSSIRRIDVSGLRAIEELARLAEQKGVRFTLHGVNVDIYKALKLAKLTGRFSFAN